jgi:hypothetical protein
MHARVVQIAIDQNRAELKVFGGSGGQWCGNARHSLTRLTTHQSDDVNRIPRVIAADPQLVEQCDAILRDSRSKRRMARSNFSDRFDGCGHG